MENKISEALKEYENVFGNVFPEIPLFWRGTDEEYLQMINDCINQKRSAAELGYC